jgi:hypothetical protein
MAAINLGVGVHLTAEERRAAASAKSKLPCPIVKAICKDCHGTAVVCVVMGGIGFINVISCSISCD